MFRTSLLLSGALGRLKDPQATTALTAHLNDADEGVREACDWALEQISRRELGMDDQCPDCPRRGMELPRVD